MNSQDCSHAARISLEGLSVGDALGERMFNHHYQIREIVDEVNAPSGPFWYTDDTEMATVIVEQLETAGCIDQDELALRFGQRFARRPDRGYGSGARLILSAINAGEPWEALSKAAFGGKGSMGNGAAMRVAPLGAFFADDFHKVVQEAERSAMVTHYHPEGVAGAVGVALAAAAVT